MESKETKIFPGQTLDFDPETGLVEAYVSVTGILDDDIPPDLIEMGAFGKTIQERGPQGANRIRVLWQHYWREVIGMPIVLAEHSRDLLPAKILEKFPTATGGLYTKTQFIMEVQRGREAYALYKAKAMDEWSIGFDVVTGTWEKLDDMTFRRLKELRLWEYSPVTWGANPATATTDVKAVVPYQDLPLANEDRAWDRNAAEKRVRAWAGGDPPDWAKYRKAHVWYDSKDPEKLGSYKLLIADIIDGKLTAVPRGIFAAAGAVQGARTAINIPDSEMPGVKAHLARYYKKMDRIPPWESDALKRVTDLAIDILGESPDIDIPALLAQMSARLNEAEPGEPLTSRKVAQLRAKVLETEIRLSKTRS